jgi:integrase
MRRARVRIEQDRHFKCEAGWSCRAPALRRRLAAGRNKGECVPRKTWWVRFMVNGKRLSEGYRDKAEAEQRQRKITALIDLDQSPTLTNALTAPMFRDIAENSVRWYCDDRALRRSTVENHESILERHVLPYFSDMPVDAAHFDRDAMRGFIRHLRGSDGTVRILADPSIKVVLPTLCIILDYAVEKKYLLQNPLRGGSRLWRAEERSESIDPFTPEELGDIISSAYEIEHDFGCLVQLVSQCCLRPGEGLGLRRCDLDLKTAEVHVKGTFSRGRLGKPKTASSTRVVSLVDHVLVDETLSRSIIGRLKTMKLTNVDPESRLFPLSAVAYWPRRWTQALTKAGVRYRKPHNLRHSFASIRLSRGANLLEVQEAGGWRSATVLLTTYAKWIKQGAKKTTVGARMHAIDRATSRDR